MSKSKQKARYYYKAVRAIDTVRGTEFHSEVASLWCGLSKKYNIVYKVGEWTKPRVATSKIFCFKTLKQAKEYYGECNESNIQIFRCLVKNPRKARGFSYCVTSIDNFWQKYGSGKIKWSQPPDGTYFCDEVMLVEKILPIKPKLEPDPRTFYKVVSKYNNGKGLVSARWGSVKYRTKRWARPNPEYPNSKLFVFEKLEDAKNFAAPYELIYECRVINSQVPVNGVCNDFDLIESFWQDQKGCPKTREVKGTIFADAVMLIKQVKASPQRCSS